MVCRAQRLSLESDLPLMHADFGIYIRITSTCSCHRKHEYYRTAFAVPEQLFYYYGSSDNDDIELI